MTEKQVYVLGTVTQFTDVQGDQKRPEIINDMVLFSNKEKAIKHMDVIKSYMQKNGFTLKMWDNDPEYWEFNKKYSNGNRVRVEYYGQLREVL